MEPSEGPTPSQELESGIAGLSLLEPALYPDTKKLPPRSQSSQKRKRLATTRGFGNRAGGASVIVTPSNSPSKFQPELGSTPVSKQFSQSQPQATSSLYGSRQLPPHPPFSPSVIQWNFAIQKIY